MDKTVPPAQRVVAGRYRLGELLGRGGMGEVRAGRDLRLDRDVAVKLLRPDMAVQDSVRLRFESEARSAARLVHPNVVAVFDTGEDDEIPFIVMERLSGRTLADQLADGPVDERTARLLGLQVLAALGAAHHAGLVHRDVKPGNVLVAGPDHWKVGDFGIAKSLEVSGRDGQDLTMAGLVMGTPAYLAPERLTGGPATPATDLYAVGVVLYEALTGRKPIDPGAAPAAVLASVPPPLDEVRPGIDPRLARAVGRALEKDPEARFAGAADMAASLTEPPASGVVPAPPVRSRPAAVGSEGADTVAATLARAPADLEPTVVHRAPAPVSAVEPTVAHPVDVVGNRWLPMLVAAAVAVVVVVALVASLGHGTQAKAPAPPASTVQSAPAASTIPAPLDAAIQRLQRLVQP